MFTTQAISTANSMACLSSFPGASSWRRVSRNVARLSDRFLFHFITIDVPERRGLLEEGLAASFPILTIRLPHSDLISSYGEERKSPFHAHFCEVRRRLHPLRFYAPSLSPRSSSRNLWHIAYLETSTFSTRRALRKFSADAKRQVVTKAVAEGELTQQDAPPLWFSRVSASQVFLWPSTSSLHSLQLKPRPLLMLRRGRFTPSALSSARRR